ncbi:hypothetical protein OKHIL_76740 [Mycolicibacterium mageritense]|nr:hypothetical protein MTY414_77430 [Mycolicibacterium mageritense]
MTGITAPRVVPVSTPLSVSLRALVSTMKIIVVRRSRMVCSVGDLGPSKNTRYTETKAKQFSTNNPMIQFEPMSATPAMPMSEVMTNTRDCRRVGHGRTHHSAAQTALSPAKTTTTMGDAGEICSAAGKNTTRLMTPISPIAAPIITRIAPARDRVAKYRTNPV